MAVQSAKYQYFAAFAVIIISACYGIVLGWVSPAVYLLTNDESPLPTGKISLEEGSWIASLWAIGQLIGSVLFGFITNKYGRKRPLILLSIPMMVSWLMILYAQNVYYLYVARILQGLISGGVVVVAPVYLMEIANDSIRGLLTSSVILGSYTGIMFAFLLGAFFDYHIMPIVTIALTALFAILFYFFPESPTYLMKQNKLLKAEKSTRFYQNLRSKNADSKLLEFEMEKLKNSVGDKSGEKTEERSMKWMDLFTHPGRKAMLIAIVLCILNQFSGCFALVNYTASIFKVAGTTLKPNTAAMIVGGIQLIGSFLASILIDRAGRKFLYVVSTVGVAIGYLILGSYMLFKEWKWQVEAFNWVPLVSFSAITFLSTWGISFLPYVVIAEVMPANIKDFGVSFCIMLMSIFSFVILKGFPLLNDLLGMHGTMFLFAGVCIPSALFIIIMLPETKGKTYEQIMSSL